ncbi:MAG: FAD-dependent monooxygenase [Planctomycetota bacterium]
MRIACIGGGPGGLYTALLAKKRLPGAQVTVYERNQVDDTFGWGVVFSDETLGGFEEADAESYRAIREQFAYWSDIETFFGGTCVRSTGHGFCGLGRKNLLRILADRCLELGVELRLQTEVDPDKLPDADLIVAADGINSRVRDHFADHFRPHLDWRKCKFIWLGTDLPLQAFTFHFKENEHGLFQVHAYPYQQGDDPISTWIVECHEDVWKAAGFDQADEASTVAYLGKLFAPELQGHKLLTNRSIWRTFPTVSCERWTKDNIVLIGDAVHTAHFSIGSGTKLAMEDAIALVEALEAHGHAGVPAALAAYESAREVDSIRIQRAAQTSLEWFENCARYKEQHPLQFTFNLMTRSKRVTYDNLAMRDPELVRQVRDWWAQDQGAGVASNGAYPEPIFVPLRLRDLELHARTVVSPMCQYSATDGTPDDWHLVHLGSMATGSAGLVIAEATAISADGRISHGCTGIWNDEHTAAWKRITDFAKAHGASKMGLQIGHAGRKASTSRPWEGDTALTGAEAWPTIAPSAEPFKAGWHTPRAMDRADMERVLADFVAAAQRAEAAGFDLLELHMAHGYLLSSFLSPASNHRTDAYGGDLQGRMRFPLECFEAVRAVWPAHKPLAVRISASDWLPEGGMTIEDSIAFAHALGDRGVDLIDVSSGGNTPASRITYGRMYQVPFAEAIRFATGLKVMAVGAIQGWDHANTVLAAGRADLCALARPHLLDPRLTQRAAVAYSYPDLPWPPQYLVGKPRA